MTIIDTIKQAVEMADMEKDDIKKIVAMAYHIGRETGVKEVCDTHNDLITMARDEANTLRYHRLANSVIDAMGGDMIYHPDYAMDMTHTFGGDNTGLEV